MPQPTNYSQVGTLIGKWEGPLLPTWVFTPLSYFLAQRRIFAIANYVNQRLLWSVHDWAMSQVQWMERTTNPIHIVVRCFSFLKLIDGPWVSCLKLSNAGISSAVNSAFNILEVCKTTEFFRMLRDTPTRLLLLLGLPPAHKVWCDYAVLGF